MKQGVDYTLNIVNLIKPDSLYRVGMRPAMFSAIDAQNGIGWRRTGEKIAYYDNSYETEGGQPYYTLTFTLSFPHDADAATSHTASPTLTQTCQGFFDLAHHAAQQLPRDSEVDPMYHLVRQRVPPS
eukprot:CAMPEP_0114123706 /NCGR_PEP_ID=MMETSP0043_2-20121206/8389_1 /TAXON_ID=464988 /ORGANISM="Hemiselmis andersenii, Strain CCMP644" /LENGTH=126 /DNA_ID=CAMNT_0001216541 /DNA_START=51 /DNA_END=428 /DNA_ORIENTATION=-